VIDIQFVSNAGQIQSGTPVVVKVLLQGSEIYSE
jgi:hypothetical protein